MSAFKSFGAKTWLFPQPAFVVGTYCQDGKPNLSTAAWAGVCCSSPPEVSVSFRGATLTNSLIKERKAFTVSMVHASQVAEMDYVGLVSGRDHDKFRELGLTVVRSTLVDAPYAAEFPVVLECELKEVHELGLHTQYVGVIKDTKVRADCLGPDGLPRADLVDAPVFDASSGQYFKIAPQPIAKAFSVGNSCARRT
eukprot:TRINITY_DN2235_c0_g1_i2.p2 TRINITY_DN2235_c0_g1~~TRINITY_DN2235_c0_g1_i2.p2  ORF type:complete len:196 (+),score=52.00 TRINITY_DN2235_c0_g1_i2:61-648(+)